MDDVPPIISRAEAIIARLPIPISTTDEDTRTIIPHVPPCLGFLKRRDVTRLNATVWLGE